MTDIFMQEPAKWFSIKQKPVKCKHCNFLYNTPWQRFLCKNRISEVPKRKWNPCIEFSSKVFVIKISLIKFLLKFCSGFREGNFLCCFFCPGTMTFQAESTLIQIYCLGWTNVHDTHNIQHRTGEGNNTPFTKKQIHITNKFCQGSYNQ